MAEEKKDFEKTEEKKETGKKAGKLKRTAGRIRILWESIDEIILALLAFPVIGDVLKDYIDKRKQRAKEKLAETIKGDGSGVVVKESGEGLGDEIRFDDVANLLEAAKKTKLDDLLTEMELLEQGKEKIKALRIFVALKSSVTFNVNETDKTERGKIKKTSRKMVELDLGKKFLEDLLEKNTLSERVQFLKNRGVFDSIPPKKEPTGSFFDIGIQATEKTARAVESFLERNAPKIEQRLGKYAEKTKKGIEKSAKAIDKEAYDLGKWIDENIHKKVERHSFWSYWNWFFPTCLKKKKSSQREEGLGNNRVSGQDFNWS